ncbi:hypothetical protein O181_104482 [Austropuccinia psidii MF-1]|uniref:Integrase catalytic domain-containing protein n=1 Tax=Austropuccinia psidii MF-1 TaxID=1389203 RepID=A0A9Q3JN49_9BASI|nr:hypothetical protein [Austropuccinia psidii MF-1]
MTIVHKDGNIIKNAYGLSKWPLPNSIDNPASVPAEASPQIPIEGISVKDLNTTFFEEVKKIYIQDTNGSILCSLLTMDCKDHSLIHALDGIWRKTYDEGIFHLLDGIIYYRTNHTCVMAVVDRFSNSPIFLPCHKDDKAIETALLIWNTIVSWTGIFTNIISDRDPKFTSALWKTLHQLFGTKLSFSIAYHPNTDGLAERMIQSLEDMARRFCEYGIEFEYCDRFTLDWCTLLPALELAYKTSIQTSTNQTPSILEKGWNPKLPHDSLRKQLAEIHPTAASFKGMLVTARKHAVRLMEYSFTYTNDKWDKSHATPDFKVGDSVLVSPTNFNNIKGCKKLKNSFSGPFVNKALHGEKAIEVQISEEPRNKLPTFPMSWIKPYKSSDAEKFPLRNEVPQVISPIV